MRRLITGTLLACALVGLTPDAHAQRVATADTSRFSQPPPSARSPRLPEQTFARRVADVCRDALSLDPTMASPSTDAERDALYERYVGRLTIALGRMGIPERERDSWSTMCDIYLAGGADTSNAILAGLRRQTAQQ